MQKKQLLLIILAAGIIGAFLFFLFKSTQENDSTRSLDTFKADPFAAIVTEGLPAGVPERVEELIEKAKIELNNQPDKWESWVAVGVVYNMAEQFEEAILAYEVAEQVSPNNIVASANIAQVYDERLKDYDKAEEYYKKAIDNNIIYVPGYINLANFYKNRRQDVQAGIETLEAGLIPTERNLDMLVQLVEMYKVAGDTEKAKQYALEVIEKDPGNQLYIAGWKDLLDSK